MEKTMYRFTRTIALIIGSFIIGILLSHSISFSPFQNTVTSDVENQKSVIYQENGFSIISSIFDDFKGVDISGGEVLLKSRSGEQDFVISYDLDNTFQEADKMVNPTEYDMSGFLKFGTFGFLILGLLNRALYYIGRLKKGFAGILSQPESQD